MHKTRLAVGQIKDGCITLTFEKDGTIHRETKPLKSNLVDYNFIEVPEFVVEAGKRAQEKLHEPSPPMGVVYEFPKQRMKA